MNHLVLTSDAVDYWLNRSLLEDYCGFDTEAESLDHTGIMAGFSLYMPKQKEAVYVALCHPGHNLALTPAQIEKVAALKVKTFNGGFDLFRWEYNFGSKPVSIGDGDLVSKMLQLHKFGLKNLAQDLGLTLTVIRLEDVLGAGNYNFTKAPLNDKTRDYGCQDAILACDVEEKLLEVHWKFEHHPGWNQVYPLELACMDILERATCEGLPINKVEFETAAAKMKCEADDLAFDICGELNRDPQTFKLNSPKKLSSALYNSSNGAPNPAAKTEAQREMTLPGLGLTPPDNSTSSATDILELIEDQHPVVTKILRWKKLNAVVTRDLPQMAEFALKGMMHPQFVQIGEDGTSRIYTKQPNLISMSMEARRAMPPRPGKVYAHIDFDAAEWRIAALLSGEVKVLAALDAGIDPHKFTYSEMTGVPIDQVTRDQREVGKVLNYASLYGASPYRIARSLRIEQGAAAVLLSDFWATYPLLKKWIEFRKEYCRQHARTYTVLGRSRALKEVFTKDEGRKKAAMRQAVNTAGQGSCGDALKLALVNLDTARRQEGILNHYNCAIRCPVFDAVLLELDEACMEDSITLGAAEAAILKEVEVTLTWEGRSTVMKAHVGWSKTSWADACGKGTSILDQNTTPQVVDPTKERTFSIYAGADKLGNSRGTSFEEACNNFVTEDVAFALGYDPTTLSFNNIPLMESVPA